MKKYALLITLLFAAFQLNGQTMQRKNLNPYTGTFELQRGEGFDLNIYVKDGRAYVKSSLFDKDVWLRPIRNSDNFTIEEEGKKDDEKIHLEFLKNDKDQVDRVRFKRSESRSTILIRKKGS